ncbi:MAG: dihydroorotate dehydrogenase (quinone) [Gammaproteobacteria bacterium]|nr:dihydroorotate dehydrogenase (quinone) [Gammaproteobacteria bacterium]|tara:strand:- start:144 stop:1169 length:1026 start_codon:yes stop_codon:yes gene_type:complete
MNLTKIFFTLYQRLIFLFEPEKAHYISLTIAETLYKSWLKRFLKSKTKKFPTDSMGIKFENPIGLAAGFDKNGDYLNFISNIGFGFVEIGTVTPKPQIGNPKPRIFRIKEEQAIINHLGFNNKGVDYLKSNLKNFRQVVPIGVNIGKNSSTPIENAYQDYEYCMRQIYSLCDYISLNISSPNTKDLRDLHLEKYMNGFLKNIKKLHEKLIKVYKMRIPLILKISPDLTEDQIISICRYVKKYEIEGIIATNTTVNKSLLQNNKYHYFQGGLSGKPLNEKSNTVIELLKTNLNNDVAIIGVGGVHSYQSAKQKMDNGAKLLQMYTGLVYSGTNLIKEIVENL